MQRHIGWNVGRVEISKNIRLTWYICVSLILSCGKTYKLCKNISLFFELLLCSLNSLFMSEYHYEGLKRRELINGTDHPFLHIRNAHSFIRKQETFLPHQVPEKKHCKIFLKARSLHKFQEWDKSSHLRSRLSPHRTRREPKWPPLAYSCWLEDKEKGARNRQESNENAR